MQKIIRYQIIKERQTNHFKPDYQTYAKNFYFFGKRPFPTYDKSKLINREGKDQISHREKAKVENNFITSTVFRQPGYEGQKGTFFFYKLLENLNKRNKINPESRLRKATYLKHKIENERLLGTFAARQIFDIKKELDSVANNDGSVIKLKKQKSKKVTQKKDINADSRQFNWIQEQFSNELPRLALKNRNQKIKKSKFSKNYLLNELRQETHYHPLVGPSKEIFVPSANITSYIPSSFVNYFFWKKQKWVSQKGFNNKFFKVFTKVTREYLRKQKWLQLRVSYFNLNRINDKIKKTNYLVQQKLLPLSVQEKKNFYFSKKLWIQSRNFLDQLSKYRSHSSNRFQKRFANNWVRQMIVAIEIQDFLRYLTEKKKAEQRAFSITNPIKKKKYSSYTEGIKTNLFERELDSTSFYRWFVKPFFYLEKNPAPFYKELLANKPKKKKFKKKFSSKIYKTIWRIALLKKSCPPVTTTKPSKKKLKNKKKSLQLKPSKKKLKNKKKKNSSTIMFNPIFKKYFNVSFSKNEQNLMSNFESISTYFDLAQKNKWRMQYPNVEKTPNIWNKFTKALTSLNTNSMTNQPISLSKKISKYPYTKGTSIQNQFPVNSKEKAALHVLKKHQFKSDLFTLFPQNFSESKQFDTKEAHITVTDTNQFSPSLWTSQPRQENFLSSYIHTETDLTIEGWPMTQQKENVTQTWKLLWDYTPLASNLSEKSKKQLIKQDKNSKYYKTKEGTIMKGSYLLVRGQHWNPRFKLPRFTYETAEKGISEPMRRRTAAGPKGGRNRARLYQREFVLKLFLIVEGKYRPFSELFPILFNSERSYRWRRLYRNNLNFDRQRRRFLKWGAKFNTDVTDRLRKQKRIKSKRHFNRLYRDFVEWQPGISIGLRQLPRLTTQEWRKNTENLFRKRNQNRTHFFSYSWLERQVTSSFRDAHINLKTGKIKHATYTSKFIGKRRWAKFSFKSKKKAFYLRKQIYDWAFLTF